MDLFESVNAVAEISEKAWKSLITPIRGRLHRLEDVRKAKKSA
jgi:hypothetical protein